MLTAPIGQEFRFCNGRASGNLMDFFSVLKTLSAGDFSHHVNSEKNDFYNWIFHSLNERGLAAKVKNLKTNAAFIRNIGSFLRKKPKA